MLLLTLNYLSKIILILNLLNFFENITILYNLLLTIFIAMLTYIYKYACNVYLENIYFWSEVCQIKTEKIN